MGSIRGLLHSTIYIALTISYTSVNAESPRADVQAVKAKVYSAIFKSQTQIVCIENAPISNVDEFPKYISDLTSALNVKSDYDRRCGSYNYDITGSQTINQSLCLFVKATEAPPTESRKVGKLQQSCS